MERKSISHYRIEEKLGEGGMGVVYKAQDTKLDRHVAIKLMSRVHSGESAKKRFIQEAKAASALDHPNVCTIHEIGESGDGDLYITMAYYEGESLEKRLRRGKLDLDEGLDVAIQLTRGLACAHEHNITHRDIKPGNIMITDRGEVKIVDFGLAKLAGQTQLTQSGSMVGTAGYMAPEQLSNGTHDHRCDIFSVGLVLYEMFTGVHPFQSDYYQALLYSIMYDDPEPVTKVNPDLPPELEWIISKAIEKNPDDRFQDMNEVVQFLEALKSGSIQSEGLDLDQLGLKSHSTVKETYIQRNRRYLIPATLVVVLMVTGIFLWSVPSYRTSISQIFSTPSIPSAKQIAVLSFRNIGNDPVNQAFADGLVETITSKLSQLDQFQDDYLVVPASEIQSKDIRSASEARAAFGVNLVITGSVQKLDRGVRVTLNLIDAVSLRQIDSKIIDDTFIEKSILQDNAVFNLASMLNIEVQPEAKTLLTAGTTSEPGAYEFYLQGLGYLQRFDRVEQINAAIERFQRALKEDPDYALAYSALGDAYLYLYRRTEDLQWLDPAITNTQKAIKLDNRLSPVHTTLGVLLIEKGEYEKAHESLERALKLDPANFEAYRARARAFKAQQRIDEAEATYHAAIEKKPEYWAGYAELGVFYSQIGRFKEAAEQFRNVTELTPNNAGAFRNLGAIYYYLNRPEDALKAFQRSVEIQPNYGVYSNMGTMYYYDGKYNEAAKMYAKALELNDTDYLVWSNLASAYKYATPPQPDKSLDAIRRARDLAEKQLEVNPRKPNLLVSLASYNLDLGDQEQSRKLLNRAIKMEPSDVGTQMNIGIIYEYYGNRTEALRWVEKALAGGYPVEEIQRSPDPKLSQLREDPTFLEIVKEQGEQ